MAEMFLYNERGIRDIRNYFSQKLQKNFSRSPKIKKAPAGTEKRGKSQDLSPFKNMHETFLVMSNR